MRTALCAPKYIKGIIITVEQVYHRRNWTFKGHASPLLLNRMSISKKDDLPNSHGPV